MSGVTLLAANEKLQDAIRTSYQRAIGMQLLNKTYWIVTLRVPNQIKGREHLCMSKELNRSETRNTVILFLPCLYRSRIPFDVTIQGNSFALFYIINL